MEPEDLDCDGDGDLQDAYRRMKQQPSQQAILPQAGQPVPGLLGAALGGFGGGLAGRASLPPLPDDLRERILREAPTKYEAVFNTSVDPLTGDFRNRSSRTINFYRINEKVSIGECEEVTNPIDVLRIQVAKWLYS